MSLVDTQIGWLVPAFMLVYMVTAPLFGALGRSRLAHPPDRHRRVPLEPRHGALGTGAHATRSCSPDARWSASAKRPTWRSRPALLADCFAVARRGRVFAVFNMAIPVGSALGYVLGGLIGHHFGWRAAFFVAGAPGMLLAFAVLRACRSAARRAGGAAAAAARPAALQRAVAVYLGLLRRPPYMLVVLGYAAYTFALGGLALWMPTFLERVRGVSPDAGDHRVRRHRGGDRFRRHVRRRLARGLPAALHAAGVPVVHRRGHARRGAAGAAGTHRADTRASIIRRSSSPSCCCSCRPARSTQRSSTSSRRWERASAVALSMFCDPSAGRRALAGADRLPVRSRLTRRARCWWCRSPSPSAALVWLAAARAGVGALRPGA